MFDHQQVTIDDGMIDTIQMGMFVCYIFLNFVFELKDSSMYIHILYLLASNMILSHIAAFKHK